MISIKIVRNDQGQVVSCHAEGHAGYDEHGYDIVCAAVSVLTATTMLGLTKQVEQAGEYSNSSGQCDMVLLEPIEQGGQDILETMVLGLREIASQYSDFVKIDET